MFTVEFIHIWPGDDRTEPASVPALAARGTQLRHQTGQQSKEFEFVLIVSDPGKYLDSIKNKQNLNLTW